MDRHNENFILSAETLDHRQVKEFLGITSENPLILSSERQILLIPITKKNLLLHCDGNDIFETLTVAKPTEANNVFQFATASLGRYFQPKVSNY